jgi:hypothetical protein
MTLLLTDGSLVSKILMLVTETGGRCNLNKRSLRRLILTRKDILGPRSLESLNIHLNNYHSLYCVIVT